MAKLALNKSVMNRQKKQLQTYQRYLPALELKQQQLMLERKKAETVLQALQQRMAQRKRQIAETVPMLGCEDIDLTGLVKVTGVELAEEYQVGIALPLLKQVSCEVSPYSLLARPHWVDNVTELLQEMLHLELERQVMQQRLDILREAARAATQRVNLFSKILIPETRQVIKKIGVLLSDAEAAAVVRAKMTKQKQAAVVVTDNATDLASGLASGEVSS